MGMEHGVGVVFDRTHPQFGDPSVAAKSFDDALANASPVQRTALEKLRSLIATLVPEAIEGVNYGIAVFQVGGKSLVGLAAAKTHCSFVMMTGHTVEQFEDELKDFGTSKSVIRFTPDSPCPRRS